MKRQWVGMIIMVLAVTGVVAQEAPGPEDAVDAMEPGGLILRDSEGTVFGRAPTQETDVDIAVRGLLANTTVSQRFTNPTDRWMEGVYVFPLPNRAAVHAMRMVIGDRIIEGQVKERAEAKRTYQAAKRAGRKASLVEQERPNIFTTSVANIGPGEAVEIRIEYQQSLTFDRGRLELRFPMVVGTRYMPGLPAPGPAQGSGWSPDTDQVPDASRISPPMLPTGDSILNPVRLQVSLEPGFPLASLLSPTHPVRIGRVEGGRYRIAFDTPVPADRDFVLQWTADAGRSPRAAVFAEEWNGETYVLAMVVPPDDTFAESVRLPRETIFVIDTSGSMGGSSIVQARQALLDALDRLAPEDYFNIIEFDSSYTTLFPESKPAMPAAVEEARVWVGRLQANGGTEMRGALVRALEDDRERTPLRQVVFITDGCVGNEAALFGEVERRLGRSRLFTVGIGSAPNGFFMERAAAFGRGTFTFIGTSAEVDSTMRGLFEKLENPVLADIDLVWPDPDAEVWPERVPDLYAGEPVMVAARLGTTAGDLRVSGIRADARWDTAVPLAIGTDRAGVHRLWARRKIAALMDERSRGAAEGEVRDRVLGVALKHRLVSKYTSLVAVDVTPARPQDEALKTAAVPANLPAGWDPAMLVGRLPAGGTAARLHLVAALALLMAGIALRRLKPKLSNSHPRESLG